jgi:UDP-N-acetylmuramoyl-tripeptide--D-alanyl-D-alanine ligase
MKNLAKSILVGILGWQLRRLLKKADVKVVAVAGSVGKTTTKHVIAGFLEGAARVHYQEGNYNVPLTVPLVFFNEEIPALLNPIAWIKLLVRNEQKIRDFYPYDVVIVELGIDQVGEMDQFAKYLSPDVAVLTSIAPEHMEFFNNLDQVADEELKIRDFSNRLIVGIDDIPQVYRKYVSSAITYGLEEQTDYHFIPRDQNITIKSEDRSIQTTTRFVGKHVQKSLAAAVAVADSLELWVKNEAKVLARISPMPGRMQLLEGKKGSLIIDDTYNNVSQVPLMAALDVLYSARATKRIAVLGNMNELGRFSKGAHEQVGAYCDPKKLDLVVTIGPDSNKYLAAAAKKAGCEVVSYDSPYEVGEFLKTKLDKGTVVLVKGSQNRVYLEEAVKFLLANLSDRSKLVRQSKWWLSRKEKQFKVHT